ncbi:hypothetical protein ACTUVN_003574, partial [Pseudomonas caspiana]
MDDGYLKVATRRSGASEKFWYAKQTTFMPACSATGQLHPATALDQTTLDYLNGTHSVGARLPAMTYAQAINCLLY